MKSITLLAGTAALVALMGCSNPADTVPAATVQTAANAPDAAAKAASDRYYALGTNSSVISFVGSKVTGSHKGGFHKFSGEFRVVNEKLADSGNRVVIDTTSLWADNDRLTGHLKSPDFFDVAKFPSATFVSTSITPNETNSTVTGNLTLHGVTKQISFPAVIKLSDDALTVVSEFFINRFDFGMQYAGKADDLIRKEVVLKLNVKATAGRPDMASTATAKPTAKN